MSILGTVVRTRPEHLHQVVEQLSAMPGLDVALNPGDGRLVVVIEDSLGFTAAQSMASMALIPEILNTSLVYEHTEDVQSHAADGSEFQSWRSTLTEMAHGAPAGASAKFVPTA